MRRIFFFIVVFCFAVAARTQDRTIWSADGSAELMAGSKGIVRKDVRTGAESVLISSDKLIDPVTKAPLNIESFAYSNDQSKLLLFTNAQKVWRYKTRGDYWVIDANGSRLRKVGTQAKPGTLMFAKFSPDGKYVAFVSESNIYVDDANTGITKKLTNDGTRKLINGTFDWVYEEEFGCRDGFRWGPDSRNIAFWQVDATKVRDYYMINNTDSVYSRLMPVEYPKVGEPPSPVKIGVVSILNGATKWMTFEGDARQHYIPRMDWSGTNELIVQRLNRKQNESKLIYCNTLTGATNTFWAENDAAWVDLNSDDPGDTPNAFRWMDKGQSLVWISEKDGWRHVYKISRDGRNITDLTKGDFDIAALKGIDEAGNNIYFTASPQNATQRYLYRMKLNASGKNDPELLSPSGQTGWHDYTFTPNLQLARHSFSNAKTFPMEEVVTIPNHKTVGAAEKPRTDPSVNVEYMKLKTEDNIVLDAWINKPNNFDPNKKYPIVFYVYGEPAASTVEDVYGNHKNFLYAGDMSADGYIQASIDVRGTPSLKGAGWRKSIYRKIGRQNIRDYALGAKEILKLPYVDKSRVAVWGWSGGGSSTLNLMFQYPEIFQTGISIAAVTNMLYYDNIYEERYMGLPQENPDDYRDGSAAFKTAGLKGKLLYVHGTGDDNVHYSNAELLVNELVKNGKQFQYMAYPNRTHGISEGEGTSAHLATLYTEFLRKNCPPGAK